MEDAERDTQFKTFMTAYALDIFIVMCAAFWHVFFLIVMGIVTSGIILLNINTLNGTGASGYGTAYIPIEYGWKLLLFGVFCGFTNYLAGMALSVNKETILKMVGFTATLDNEASATMATLIGGVTTTITISQDEESKKNFFDLFEVMENWSLLFFSQRALQIALPYAYLIMLEASVAMVFVTCLLFFYPVKE